MDNVEKLIKPDDRFYICHKCNFIGWRESAQGPCCMDPDQIYVVDWIFEEGREVMIKPESK